MTISHNEEISIGKENQPYIQIPQRFPSVILARRVRKYVDIVDSPNGPILEEKKATIEWCRLIECDLPILYYLDEIRLSDKDVYTTILKVAHGTNGKIYYDVSYIMEYVDEIEKSTNEILERFEKAKDDFNHGRTKPGMLFTIRKWLKDEIEKFQIDQEPKRHGHIVLRSLFPMSQLYNLNITSSDLRSIEREASSACVSVYSDETEWYLQFNITTG